jgi:hypothetical protein
VVGFHAVGSRRVAVVLVHLLYITVEDMQTVVLLSHRRVLLAVEGLELGEGHVDGGSLPVCVGQLGLILREQSIGSGVSNKQKSDDNE